ncbi:MAG: hypothetical protein J1F18_10790 [Lachnospiraceae bacterium]|nr:hypothetical protein [Lachnospiraceae bacterium]
MDQIEKELEELVAKENASYEGNIRSRTLSSIDKRLVCFISAYRKTDKETGELIPEEINEANTEELAHKVRNEYGFGYRVHLGYYKEKDSLTPEYEKSLAVNGYTHTTGEDGEKLIAEFRNIMLTLAREYNQDTILLSIPNQGADLIDVNTNKVIVHFTNLTEEQLSAEFMEQRKKDLSQDFAYTSLGFRKDRKDRKDVNFGKGDKGRRVQWVVESIEEYDSIRGSISHSKLIGAMREKAAKESLVFYKRS